LIRALTALVLLALPAGAAELTFGWDKNPEDDIAGYRLHFGSESGRYTRSIDCGNVTRFTLEVDWDPVLKIGTEQFSVVTAYNTAGLESFPSNELDLGAAPPSAPKNPRVTLPDPSVASVYLELPATGFSMMHSPDLRTWRPLGDGFGFMIASVDVGGRHFFSYSTRY
jgi:hypothetical protein